MAVDKIIVDREAGEIQCYIKRLPAIARLDESTEHQSSVLGAAPTGIFSTQYHIC